jgi:hypothetical protein
MLTSRMSAILAEQEIERASDPSKHIFVGDKTCFPTGNRTPIVYSVPSNHPELSLKNISLC